MTDKKQPGVKVKDLIKALRKMPADADVSLEGCDCIGSWNGKIEERNYSDSNEVLLCR